MPTVAFLIRFFFQAEDGIRDRTVTGVQTCALPISAGDAVSAVHARAGTKSGGVRSSMSSLPRPMIAIVGRPNVGKSTLFNRLVGQRRALVRDVPGVTRDRLYGHVEFERWQATVIDTGGFDPSS